MKKLFKLFAVISLVVSLTACAGLQPVSTPPKQDGQVVSLEQLTEKSGANVVRAFTALTGGGTGSLDKISRTTITNGDIAMVVTGNIIYFYQYNTPANAAESSPTYIRPNDWADIPEGQGSGVWYLVDVRAKGVNTGTSSTPSLDFYDSDAADGDINAKIYANCTTTTSGAEVCSIYFQTQGLSAENAAGTLTTRLSIDTANDLLDTTLKIRGAIPIVAASSTPLNLTAAEALGSIVFASYAGATTINLPDYTAARSASKAKVGSSVCIYSSLAQQLIVDTAGDDKIRLDGTLGAAGATVTSDSAAGDYACFILTDAASDVGHWTLMGYGKTAWQVP
jgi:predicted small lipoprotein YifL